jgi:hypothetical protein
MAISQFIFQAISPNGFFTPVLRGAKPHWGTMPFAPRCNTAARMQSGLAYRVQSGAAVIFQESR